MKIKLLYDLPVGREHGLTKGRVIEVEDEEVWTDDNGNRVRMKGTGRVAYWVRGDTGERVGVLLEECETY